MTEITDFEYPDIKRTDFIDDSLPKILARDDASKNSFRRVETFPPVTEENVGMKVWLVGVGNFQLVAVDPEPQWKQLTDDKRNPAYTDWIIDNYQPLSELLTSFSRLSGASGAIPYFNGPNDMQATTITAFIKDLLTQNDPESARELLELGTASTLNTPIDGKYIQTGTISKDKIDADFARNLGWTTGDVKLTYKSVADEGWVMMNDGSIGNASSGATTRANADCYDLFMLLWNIPATTVQTFAGVPTNKTTAIQDWSGNKRLVLPKVLGRALASAGSGEGLSPRGLGSNVGAEKYISSYSNYAKLTDGTIIQWGTSSHNTYVSFPIPFQSADSYQIGSTWTNQSKYTNGVQLTYKAATGFTFWGRNLNWIAIGK